jgi:hypothetical protein
MSTSALASEPLNHPNIATQITAQKRVTPAIPRRIPPVPIDAVQFDALSPYAANLCPLSGGVEFAGFRENFGESIGELIEAVLRRAVRERTTEHLEGMLSEQ